ncbi:hypothetical protein GCM10010169_49140 [Micromonospora fulviviridis]|nr:hypothetical protein GCM10010169_49140 [Micromonospora fulviviridis]
MAVCARGLAVYPVIQGVGSVGTFFVAAAPTGVAKDLRADTEREHHDNRRRAHDDAIGAGGR